MCGAMTLQCRCVERVCVWVMWDVGGANIWQKITRKLAILFPILTIIFITKPNILGTYHLTNVLLTALEKYPDARTGLQFPVLGVTQQFTQFLTFNTIESQFVTVAKLHCFLVINIAPMPQFKQHFRQFTMYATDHSSAERLSTPVPPWLCSVSQFTNNYSHLSELFVYWDTYISWPVTAAAYGP